MKHTTSLLAMVLIIGASIGNLHAAEPAVAVAHTPQGIACPQGIVEVQVESPDSFDFRGQRHSRKSLKKALIAAHKASRFDCVLITGGTPTTDAVRDLVMSLSRKNIHHVEWTGTAKTPATLPQE